LFNVPRTSDYEPRDEIWEFALDSLRVLGGFYPFSNCITIKPLRTARCPGDCWRSTEFLAQIVVIPKAFEEFFLALKHIRVVVDAENGLDSTP
jgi:hypothetical protein